MELAYGFCCMDFVWRGLPWIVGSRTHFSTLTIGTLASGGQDCLLSARTCGSGGLARRRGVGHCDAAGTPPQFMFKLTPARLGSFVTIPIAKTYGRREL